MKIKTLLFGAGDGARIYISNNSNQREFIGLIDNDINKKGKTIHGLPVYCPSDIAKLEYTEIVIATQWALEVEQQLLNELKLPRNQVIMPPKNQLKKHTPFYCEATRAFGRYIIQSICKLAIEHKVALVIDFGTLLGITRDDDIILWDDDIDMSMPQQDFDKVCEIVESFVSQDEYACHWDIQKKFDKADLGVSVVLSFDDPKGGLLDFKTSFSVRINDGGNSIHKPSLGMWYAPVMHFSQFELIQWGDVTIQVPYHHQEYLTFVYGDWQKPKKDIQMSDYANTRVVSYEEFKKAGFSCETR